MEKYKFQDPEPSNVVLMAGADEMLKISPDGFWVRGVKVEQGPKEALEVYNAFKSWLTWSQLTRP